MVELSESRRSKRKRVPSRRVLENGDTSGPSAQVHGSGSESESDSGGEATERESTPPPNASASASSNLSKSDRFNARFKTATSTPEEVLAAQQKTWISDVYKHFVMPPKIKVESGKISYLFQCGLHPSIVIARSRNDESTSNLNRHVRGCAPSVTSETRSLTTYVHGHGYSHASHRVGLALWCARRNRPFSIVEDSELINLFKQAFAGVEMPSRVTVSRDIQEIHALTKEHLREMLANTEGKIHLGADGWTSPNVYAFIGAVITYMKDGELKSTVLDFLKLTQAHSGAYLAARIAECLQDWGLDDRIGAFVGDNASNNDTLVRELQDLLPAFRGQEFQVRCFAHVLNLVAGAVLSPFAKKRSETDTDLNGLDDNLLVGDEDFEVDELEEIAREVAESDAIALDQAIEEADLDGRLEPLSVRDGSVAKVAITKLRQLASKISNSPTIREGLKAACDKAGIFFSMIKKDVSTRWNSTAELSQSGLGLRPALDRLVVQVDFNKPGGVQLRRFRLSDDEWRIIGQLSPMLDVIMYATKQVSMSAVPLIHQIIPLIDGLTSYFDKVIDDSSLHPAVRHSAMRGLMILNKYYSRTDDSVIYRIAMMLHPRYKTHYFTMAKWDASWIEAAKSIIRAEWETHYKAADTPTTSNLGSSGSSRSDRFDDARTHFTSIFDRVPSTTDALEEWLASPPIPTVDDPIKYWVGMKTAGHPLAQMALDYLSVPATSTDVERAFSRGGLTVSKLRHSLSDQSTRCATLVGSWAKDGLVPIESIIAKFKEKDRRTKKKAKVTSGNEVIDVDQS